MQTMKNVSFTSPYDQEAEAIRRRQMLAMQLEQQSQAELPAGQMAGGYYVATSPLKYLAQALKGANARSMMDQSEADSKALAARVTGDAEKWRKAMPGPSPQLTLESEGDPVLTTGKMNPPTPQARLAWALEGLGNPMTREFASKVGADALKGPNDWMRNVAHLDPGKYTPESIDAARLSNDPWDLRYRVTPSAGLNAQVAREKLDQRQREWASLSPYQLQQLQNDAAKIGISAQELWFNTGIQAPTPTAPGPTGPGAGPRPTQPQGAPVPLGFPPPQPKTEGVNGQLRILDSEIAQVTQMIAGTQDPRERDRLSYDLQSLQNERGRYAQNQPAPAPQASPAPQPLGSEPPISPRPGQQLPPKERMKLEAERPQAAAALRTVSGALDRMMSNVDQLERSAGLSNITGPVAGRLFNVGRDSNNAQALLDTLKSQIGVQTLQEMRATSKTGGAVGNVTEKEWPILQNQLEALQQTQSTDQFRQRLADLKRTIQRIRTSAEQTYRDTYGGMPDAQGGALNPAEQAELEDLRRRLGRR